MLINMDDGRELVKELKNSSYELDAALEDENISEDEYDLKCQKFWNVQDKVISLLRSIGIEEGTAKDMTSCRIYMDKLYRIFGI